VAGSEVGTVTHPCDYDPDEDDFVDCDEKYWPDDADGPCMNHPGYGDWCADVNGQTWPTRL
jgi:hypothetical protein